jgi:hypothetical protein
VCVCVCVCVCVKIVQSLYPPPTPQKLYFHNYQINYVFTSTAHPHSFRRGAGTTNNTHCCAAFLAAQAIAALSLAVSTHTHRNLPVVR